MIREFLYFREKPEEAQKGNNMIKNVKTTASNIFLTFGNHQFVFDASDAAGKNMNFGDEHMKRYVPVFIYVGF